MGPVRLALLAETRFDGACLGLGQVQGLGVDLEIEAGSLGIHLCEFAQSGQLGRAQLVLVDELKDADRVGAALEDLSAVPLALADNLRDVMKFGSGFFLGFLLLVFRHELRLSEIGFESKDAECLVLYVPYETGMILDNRFFSRNWDRIGPSEKDEQRTNQGV